MGGPVAVAVYTRITNIVDILSHTEPENGCSCASFHRRHALMSSMQSFKNSASKRYRYNDTVTVQNNTIKNIAAFTKREFDTFPRCMRWEFDTSPRKSGSIASKSCSTRSRSLSGLQYQATANMQFQKFRVE